MMEFSVNKQFHIRGLVSQWLGVFLTAGSLLFDQHSYLFFLGIFLFLLGWVVEIMSKGNVTFWAKVKNHPDLAYDWFKKNNYWFVLDDASENTIPASKKRDWVGPFRLCVPKLQGRMIRIYAKADGYEKSQEEFLRLVQTAEN